MREGKTPEEQEQHVGGDQEGGDDQEVPALLQLVPPQMVGARNEGEAGEDQGDGGKAHVDILQEGQLLGELFLAYLSFMIILYVHSSAKVEDSQ